MHREKNRSVLYSTLDRSSLLVPSVQCEELPPLRTPLIHSRLPVPLLPEGEVEIESLQAAKTRPLKSELLLLVVWPLGYTVGP